jgi:hypothetical protein
MKKILAIMASIFVAIMAYGVTDTETWNHTGDNDFANGRFTVNNSAITLDENGNLWVKGPTNATAIVTNGASTTATIGALRQSTITFSSTVKCTTANPTTNVVGGIKLFTFPQGVIVIKGAVLNGVIAATNVQLTATNLTRYALGTAAATAASGTLGTASATICTLTTNGVATSSHWSYNATNLVLDGSSTAPSLWLNMGSETKPSTNVVSGTAKVTWMWLGPQQ